MKLETLLLNTWPTSISRIVKNSRFLLKWCDHAFFGATVFCHHMCFSFAISFLTRLPHVLLSLSFQSNPSVHRVEPLHNFYCWKADMLLKVLVVNCEAVSCAAILFMQWAIRFPFEPLRVSHQATWLVSFSSQYWWQRQSYRRTWSYRSFGNMGYKWCQSASIFTLHALCSFVFRILYG